MHDTEVDPRGLKIQAQEVKERLLKADSAEGIVTELALLHCLVARVEAAAEKLDMQQRTFELALATRDVLIAADGGVAYQLPSQVTIDADHLINPEDGFYNLEHNEKGRPFRWTGPDAKFSFAVYVDRSAPLLITASFLSAVDQNMFPLVQCFVDNQRADSVYAVESGVNRIYAELPRRAARDTSRTTLTFVLPAVTSPSDLNPDSTDTRLLGLAFTSLSIAPGQMPASADKAAESGGREPSRKTLHPRALVASVAGAKDA